MSDYISKSAASEMLMDIEWENGTLTAAILMLNDIPTLSETEIIRKPFERVVERLEENAQKMSEAKAIRPYAKHSPADHRYYKAISVKKAIEILKEECGINE